MGAEYADAWTRKARGRRVREVVPRKSLGETADRPEGYDVVGHLYSLEAGHMESLVERRRAHMALSLLSFYCDSVAIMAGDLARGPGSGIEVRLCGDAHLLNFGIFAGGGRVIFDFNDFDETEVGPFEWDVKRLITSLVIASGGLGHHKEKTKRIALAAVETYQKTISELSGQTLLDSWFYKIGVAGALGGLEKVFVDPKGTVRGLRVFDEKALSQIVSYSKRGSTIKNILSWVSPLSAARDNSMNNVDVYEIVKEYSRTLSSEARTLLSQYTVRDAARYMGEVAGEECLVVLLSGRDEGDSLLLQIKESRESAIGMVRGVQGGAGERVVTGTKLLQAAPDLFLGWQSIGPLKKRRSFYVRQLHPERVMVDVERMSKSQLMAYGKACAEVLARAHARSGAAAEISGYIGKGTAFGSAMYEFADWYRRLSSSDYEAYKAAGAGV